MAVHWFKLEKTWMKKLKTLPILVLHFFPQYRASRVLYFWWKGETEKWPKEKLFFERDISSIGVYVFKYLQILNVLSMYLILRLLICRSLKVEYRIVCTICYDFCFSRIFLAFLIKIDGYFGISLYISILKQILFDFQIPSLRPYRKS